MTFLVTTLHSFFSGAFFQLLFFTRLQRLNNENLDSD